MEGSAPRCRDSRRRSSSRSPWRAYAPSVRPLGVIGPLSRDVVAGSPPRIGGAPWHAARALRTLRQDAFVFAKCGADDRRELKQRLAALGLPVSVAGSGETAEFS